jgi:hypothetical protein
MQGLACHNQQTVFDDLKDAKLSGSCNVGMSCKLSTMNVAHGTFQEFWPMRNANLQMLPIGSFPEII